MDSSKTADGNGSQFERPPFLYEIRVKGRLSSEQWTDWFDDLTVTSHRGDSTLRGRVPDHAALYGLIGRLRDLAVPLVAVKVLDADAQRRLTRQTRRYDLMINVLLIIVYLVLLGGLITMAVFISPKISTALALLLLFVLLAGLAHGFWLWSGHAPWRWLTYLFWPAAAIMFLVLIPLSGWLPTEIGLTAMFLLAASGLIYAVYWMRGRMDDIKSWLAHVTAPGAEEEPLIGSNEEISEE